MTGAVRVPYAPASAAAARTRMMRDLADRGLPRDFVEDAALVLTELISNALRHARPLPSGGVRTAWRFYRDFLELTVADGGSGSHPHVADACADSLGGRGLAIVEALTQEWGVHRDGTESTVWARLTLSDTERSDAGLGGFAGGQRVRLDDEERSA